MRVVITLEGVPGDRLPRLETAILGQVSRFARSYSVATSDEKKSKPKLED